MKVFFNCFWTGFESKEDPVDYLFFKNLLSLSFGEDIEIGSIDNSDILCESIFGNTVIDHKKWVKTILFSGESRLCPHSNKYDVILCSLENNHNIINCPQFIPYIYSMNIVDMLEKIHLTPRIDIPKKDILVLISNPNGQVRNDFLDKLEKRFSVTYAGGYKNNIGYKLKGNYNSIDLKPYISQFKFMVTMENSKMDTYITEKICHSLLSQTIPIYWGSPKVTQYFNEDRYIIYDETNIDVVFEQIDRLLKNDSEWLSVVNKPVFANNKFSRTIQDIANDLKLFL